MPFAGVNPPPVAGGDTVMTLNKVLLPCNLVQQINYFLWILKRKSKCLQEIFGNGVPAAEVKSTRVGGRKMMLKAALGKEMVEAESGYGGSHFVGNCNHKGKGMLNVEGKFSNRSPDHGHPAVKVKMGGFIAFNADYHVPKPHPPKNN